MPSETFLAVLILAVIVKLITLPMDKVCEYLIGYIFRRVYFSKAAKRAWTDSQQKNAEEKMKEENLVSSKETSYMPLPAKILLAWRVEVMKTRMDNVPLEEEVKYLLASMDKLHVSTLNEEMPKIIHLLSTYKDALGNKSATGGQALRINAQIERNSGIWPFKPSLQLQVLRRLKTARQKGRRIIEELHFIDEDPRREMMLIQRFIVDLQTGYKRKIAFKAFFGLADEDSADNPVIQHYLSLFMLPLYMVGSMFYVFLYGVSLGPETSILWLQVLLVSMLQDCFIMEPAKIWFKFLVITSIVSDDVRSLMLLVRDRAKIVMNRRRGVIGNESMLVQHFNAGCRAARQFPHLQTSRLIMGLNDFDLPDVRKKVTKSSTTIALEYVSSIGLLLVIIVVFLPDFLLDVLITGFTSVLSYLILAGIAVEGGQDLVIYVMSGSLLLGALFLRWFLIRYQKKEAELEAQREREELEKEKLSKERHEEITTVKNIETAAAGEMQISQVTPFVTRRGRGIGEKIVTDDDGNVEYATVIGSTKLKGKPSPNVNTESSMSERCKVAIEGMPSKIEEIQEKQSIEIKREHFIHKENNKIDKMNEKDEERSVDSIDEMYLDADVDGIHHDHQLPHTTKPSLPTSEKELSIFSEFKLSGKMTEKPIGNQVEDEEESIARKTKTKRNSRILARRRRSFHLESDLKEGDNMNEYQISGEMERNRHLAEERRARRRSLLVNNRANNYGISENKFNPAESLFGESGLLKVMKCVQEIVPANYIPREVFETDGDDESDIIIERAQRVASYLECLKSSDQKDEYQNTNAESREISSEIELQTSNTGSSTDAMQRNRSYKLKDKNKRKHKDESGVSNDDWLNAPSSNKYEHKLDTQKMTNDMHFKDEHSHRFDKNTIENNSLNISHNSSKDESHTFSTDNLKNIQSDHGRHESANELNMKINGLQPHNKTRISQHHKVNKIEFDISTVTRIGSRDVITHSESDIEKWRKESAKELRSEQQRFQSTDNSLDDIIHSKKRHFPPISSAAKARIVSEAEEECFQSSLYSSSDREDENMSLFMSHDNKSIQHDDDNILKGEEKIDYDNQPVVQGSLNTECTIHTSGSSSSRQKHSFLHTHTNNRESQIGHSNAVKSVAKTSFSPGWRDGLPPKPSPTKNRLNSSNHPREITSLTSDWSSSLGGMTANQSTDFSHASDYTEESEFHYPLRHKENHQNKPNNTSNRPSARAYSLSEVSPHVSLESPGMKANAWNTAEKRQFINDDLADSSKNKNNEMNNCKITNNSTKITEENITGPDYNELNSEFNITNDFIRHDSDTVYMRKVEVNSDSNVIDTNKETDKDNFGSYSEKETEAPQEYAVQDE